MWKGATGHGYNLVLLFLLAILSDFDLILENFLKNCFLPQNEADEEKKRFQKHSVYIIG